MSLAIFTICLISGMYGSEAGEGQCKISERSFPGKALKGHTFKEFAVKAIVECQNTCERDPRCASYNFYIPGKVCELNSQTKEERPEDFVTDELRFYMRREGTIICLFSSVYFLDECTAGTYNCSLNALCSNNLGSFSCTCCGGFVGDGVICTGSKENIYAQSIVFRTTPPTEIQMHTR